MNAKRASALVSESSKRPAFWRGSIYEEPTWVSLAWIVGPATAAGVVIYFVLS
jgi:hypothetical protein